MFYKKRGKLFFYKNYLCTFALALEQCPDGGIGRRVGLKHQWMQVLAGSIPALGTKSPQNQLILRAFPLYQT